MQLVHLETSGIIFLGIFFRNRKPSFNLNNLEEYEIEWLVYVTPAQFNITYGGLGALD